MQRISSIHMSSAPLGIILAAVTFIVLLVAGCGTEETGGQQEPAPEPPLTYLSLGDSLAVGVGASDPQQTAYTPLYHERLSESNDREVRLENLGVSGETTVSFIGGYPDGDSQLRRAVDAVADSDRALVTLSLGGNDLLREVNATDADRQQALDAFGYNLNYILGALGNAGDRDDRAPRVAIFTLYNPAPGTFTDEWADRANDTIRSVATRQGVEVIRSDQTFEGREAEYTHFEAYQWDIHPTDAGYEALCRALAETVPPEEV